MKEGHLIMQTQIINRAQIGQLLQWANLAIPLTSINVKFDHDLPAYKLDTEQIWAMPVTLLLGAANELDTLPHCLNELQSMIYQLNQQSKVDPKTFEQVNAFNDVMQEYKRYHNFLAFTIKTATVTYQNKLIINGNDDVVITETKYQQLQNAIYNSMFLCLPESKVNLSPDVIALTEVTDKQTITILTIMHAMCSLLHIPSETIFTNLISNCTDEVTKHKFKLAKTLLKMM